MIVGTIKKIDLFGEALPQFNLKGENQIRTCCGGFVSIIMVTATLLFGLLKIKHLLSRQNPAVTSFIDEGALSSEDKFDFGENDYMLAFALIDGLQ